MHFFYIYPILQTPNKGRLGRIAKCLMCQFTIFLNLRNLNFKAVILRMWKLIVEEQSGLFKNLIIIMSLGKMNRKICSLVQLSKLSDRQTLTAPNHKSSFHKGQYFQQQTSVKHKIFEIPFYYAIFFYIFFYCTLYTPNREFISQ